MTRPQIIAMSGGFSLEPDNPRLDRYVLAQTGKERPRVCFLPTASFDSADYIDRFYRAFDELPCEPSHLALGVLPCEPSPRAADAPNTPEHLLAQDVIYVGGGDLLKLLDQWHKQRLDLILKEALESGVILAGVAAGAMALFEAGLTEAGRDQFAPARGLGLLPGSCSPHYRNDVARRVAYHRFLVRGLMPPGVGLDDGTALHYVDGQLARAVSSRADALAYRLEVHRNALLERELAIDYLDAPR